MNVAEYEALRTGAGFVRIAGRGWIAMSGSDRADFLQGLLTNDIAAMSPGSGCYAAYLTPQGRMIADMHVLAERERVVLDVDHSVKDRLVERFDALVFTEDVAITDLTPGMAAFGLHGSGAGGVVAIVAGLDGNAGDRLALYEHRAFRVGSCVAVAARIDDLGVEGYRLLVDRQAATTLHRALAEAGALEVSPGACDLVRVESGRPAFPIDMDHDTIPLEAGITERAINFDKGCYVGQEVIVRVLHRGQGRVARRLVGLTLDAADGPAAPVPSRGAAVWRGDEQVGRVTSAVRSPGIGGVVALGYVPRELADAAGSAVGVTAGDGRVAAVVTPLPFVAAQAASRSGDPGSGAPPESI